MKAPRLNIHTILKEFSGLPRFSDGRIDFSQSPKAPVVTCFVRHQGRILLLRRSNRVGTYRGKWNTVAGYLDEPKPIRQKALLEVEQELGIPRRLVARIALGQPYDFYDSQAKKSWIVHPVLLELKKRPEITLDWEHTEMQWIWPHEMTRYDTVPKLDESFRRIS